MKVTRAANTAAPFAQHAALPSTRARSIPPAVTLFALFMLGGVFGIVGVILGGPLTVAIWVMVQKLWIDPREEAA